MLFHTSYSDAFHAAFAGQTYAVAHLQSIRLPMNIDTSGCYKLFYFLTGGKKFHIDNCVYDVQPGDLFVISPREWHYFSNVEKEKNQERFVFFLYPDFLKRISSESTDLCSCFLHTTLQDHIIDLTPGNHDSHHHTGTPFCHRIPLCPRDREYVSSLIRKAKFQDGYGQELLDLSVLLELLVFVNSTYQNMLSGPSAAALHQLQPAYGSYSEQLSRILTYLDEHFTEDISLEILSKQFYLSESYLCRIFKNEVGTSIHKYVTARRITLAKDLLSQGYFVTDTCTLSGFKDYNGFLKSFVSSVGISPKKYAQFRK